MSHTILQVTFHWSLLLLGRLLVNVRTSPCTALFGVIITDLCGRQLFQLFHLLKVPNNGVDGTILNVSNFLREKKVSDGDISISLVLTKIFWVLI